MNYSNNHNINESIDGGIFKEDPFLSNK